MEGEAELTVDPLFVGATRPAMKWGVTYTAILANVVLTMEVFLVTKNLLSLLLCARDARFFELLMLWMRTKGLALAGNGRFWRASSYSPLSLPSRLTRRLGPTVRV